MSELQVPIRQVKAKERRCRCVLVYIRDKGSNRCKLPTNGPDSPFCPSCETRHPERTAAEVTVFTGVDE